MPYGFEIVDKTPDVGEIVIYGAIADEKWFNSDVTPKEFKAEMDKLKDKKAINVYINSTGGGVWAGLAIHNILKRSTADTTAYVDGIAASIASVIMQGCKTRVVTKDSLVMIHKPAAGVGYANADELRRYAEVLDKCEDQIVSTYLERVSSAEADVRAMMGKETWMGGEEAVNLGFADLLTEGTHAENCLRPDGVAIINGRELDTKVFKAFPADKLPKKQEKPAEKPVDLSAFEAQIVHNRNLL